jgi:integrase
MSRPRKTNRNLPPYVYFAKGRWFHREYLGDGRQGRETKLTGRDATDKEIWNSYLEKIGTADKGGTLKWLGQEYLQSNYFSRRAPNTQRGYKRYFDHIVDTTLRDGRQFGDLKLAQVSPGVIRKYMDVRTKSAPIIANRELEFLSVIFSYGYERDYVRLNPAKGVKPNPESPRKRYVTDEEYAAVYDVAPDYIQIGMEFAFLCRLRRAEIIGPDPADIDASRPPNYEGLQRKHILDDGLRVVRAKGSKEQIISWTPRLQKAVDRAKALPGPSSAVFLLHNSKGQKIRKRAFASAWQRTIKKAVAASGIETFTFHDLKAKGVSDFDGDKAKASGHRSLRMVDVYDRKIDTVASTK